MSNYNVYQSSNVPIKAWTQGVQFESKAMEQAKNIASLPFIHKHVAIMPDVHYGIGATVGSVIPTIDAIIPAAVGVDIGCGMIAQKLKFTANQLPNNLADLRNKIESAIPVGSAGWNDIGFPRSILYAWTNYLYPEFSSICKKYPQFEKANHVNHLASLGGGNHFIEICLDENDNVWVVLHSGSRGIGNLIGRTFIEKAREDMRKWHINLPDIDLAYIPEGTDHFNDYVQAMNWAQNFAGNNRILMMDIICSILFSEFNCTSDETTVINCHHNYVQMENHFGRNVWLTRKGAVRAREGDLGIIPGSMGARSYIVRGKGNPDSFNSCSHGAGRVMSRGEAKKKFDINDHLAATIGVECRKDIGVIDETPGAYKDIDAVMEAQKDLVEIVHTLKQVLCIKG